MENNESSSLQQRVVTGFFFALVYLVGYQLFVAGSRVFLYRILSTTDIGLYSIGIAFLGTANIIGGMGIPSALIQSEGDETEIISTGASMIIINVSISFSILIIFSGIISKIYENPNLSLILFILCISSMASLGGVPARAIARRRLEYKRLYIIMLCKDVSAGLVSLFLAYHGFEFWSLVYGRAISEIVFLVLSLTYLLSPYRSIFRKVFNPKKFSKRVAKGFLKLGVGFFVASAMINFLKNLIPIFTGLLIDVYSVGILSATLFFILLFENFIVLLSEVTFSAFSRIQQDYSGIQKGITKYLRYSSFFIIPYFVILVTIGDRLIGIILREEYVLPLGVLQILAISVLILPIGHLGTSLLKSIGDTRTLIIVNITRIITFILICITLVPEFGFFGLATGILVQYLFLIGLLVPLRGKIDFIRPVVTIYKKGVIAALVMGLSLVFLSDKIVDFSSLILVSFTSIVIFYAILYLLEGKVLLRDARELFRMVIGKRS